MQTKKLEYLLLFHLLAILVLIALQLPFLTGITAHEIIFVVFIALFIAHVVFCRKMYIDAVMSIAKKPDILQIVKFIIVIALSILIVLQIISFIMISTVIFGAAGITFNRVWYEMFRWVSNLILAAVIGLLAVNLKPVAALFGKNAEDETQIHEENSEKNAQKPEDSQETDALDE